MCSNETQLIAAGEKAKEYQCIGWITKGAFQNGGQGFFRLGFAGLCGRAQERQGKQHAQDHCGKDHEHGLPRVVAKQELGEYGAKKLPGGPKARGNAKGEAAVFCRCRAANNGKDHAKAGACDTKADKDF